MGDLTEVRASPDAQEIKDGCRIPVRSRAYDRKCGMTDLAENPTASCRVPGIVKKMVLIK